MKRGNDNFRVKFERNESSTFIGELDRRENNTNRLTVKASEIQFSTIEEAKRWYGPMFLERLGVEEHLVEDTEKQLNMIANIGDQPYLVGESTWISIKNRVDIYGKGFDLLPPEEQVRDINKVLSLFPNMEMQVICVDSKIRAMMSKEYAVIKQNELFNEIMVASIERFDDLTFINGIIDYNTTRCKIIFEELKDELSGLYGLKDSFVPGLFIESSDTGHSGNKVGAFWMNDRGHSFINSSEYIYMKHRGKNNLEKLLNKLPEIFLKYQDVLQKFAEMLTIEIAQPMSVLRKACRDLKIPKREAELLRQNLEINLGAEATCTAYDICQEILYLPHLVEPDKRVAAEEKVGKAIILDYEKLAK